MKQKILVIEPQKIILDNLAKALPEYELVRTTTAADGLLLANDNEFAAVITELSLPGHSGFEFLYEFRSYADWQAVPIIVHSTIKLGSDVLNSRAWQALSIHEYLYKPTASLAALKSSLEKATAQKVS
jgi:CheY-like chemotaxis protein